GAAGGGAGNRSAGRAGGSGTAALGGFFPRSIAPAEPEAPAGVPVGGAAEASVGAVGMSAVIPLPPVRPASLTAAPTAVRPAHGRIGRPLDLLAFMRWRRA
ncbi:MAG TPA: hypothetical protein VF744_19525, partial [Beijerinckiaceae bacterium]